MSDKNVTITITGNGNKGVVVTGEQNGGVVFGGEINTNGATVIMSSSGPVHYGSGTQVNTTSDKKK